MHADLRTNCDLSRNNERIVESKVDYNERRGQMSINNGQIETELKERGFTVLSTIGVSMWPLIREGKDSVVLVPPGEIKKNDVVLFRRADNSCVLHRVIRLRDGYYICCGDSEWTWEKVNPEQIIARMSGLYRGKKFVEVSSFSYRLYQLCWCSSLKIRKIIIRPLNKLNSF